MSAPVIRILVVDDNPHNLRIARMLLESEQMSIETADTGAEALRLARRHDYDLFLLDLRLPEMDGYQVARGIRQIAAHRHTPIIALTASEPDSATGKCLAAGMNALVPKPLDLDVLMPVIDQHLHEDQRGESPSVRRGSVPAPAGATSTISDMARRLGLSEQACHRHIRLAVTTHRNDIEEIRQSIRRRQWDRAARLAHDLKGLALEVGDAGIAGLAAKLEGLFDERAGTAGDGDDMNDNMPELGRIEGFLDELARKHDPAGSSAMPGHDGFSGEAPDMDIIRRTLELSENHDARAAGEFRRLLDGGHASGNAALNDILTCLERFDFSAATAGLRDLIASTTHDPGETTDDGI